MLTSGDFIGDFGEEAEETLGETVGLLAELVRRLILLGEIIFFCLQERLAQTKDQSQLAEVVLVEKNFQAL